MGPTAVSFVGISAVASVGLADSVDLGEVVAVVFCVCSLVALTFMPFDI